MRDAKLSGAKATSRGLRHGFAVGALETNIPITLIQKWMGHARLETTAIYTNVVGEQERKFATLRWRSLYTEAEMDAIMSDNAVT